METLRPASIFRKVVAALLDFFTVFWAAGYIVAFFWGDIANNGFRLNGGPALLLIGLMVAYFIIGRKYLGGTLWQRILKAY